MAAGELGGRCDDTERHGEWTRKIGSLKKADIAGGEAETETSSENENRFNTLAWRAYKPSSKVKYSTKPSGLSPVFMPAGSHGIYETNHTSLWHSFSVYQVCYGHKHKRIVQY